MGTSSRMIKLPLCRNASRSTRRSRTVPLQCSQLKSYMQATSLYFVDSNNQSVEVIFIHFIVCMFRERIPTVEDGVANAFEFATGHETYPYFLIAADLLMVDGGALLVKPQISIRPAVRSLCIPAA